MHTIGLETGALDSPCSILDTDLYKLSMQNAVLQHFHDDEVTIRFTNRAPSMLFSRDCFNLIRVQINRLTELRLTADERVALHKACPYFPDSYLDYLISIRLDPESQVQLDFEPEQSDEGSPEMGQIRCTITGPWRDTILYEVPIMSIISEAYFRTVDTDWALDEEAITENAKRKAVAMLSPPHPTKPLLFSEFGTRRRRSLRVQELVVQGLIAGVEEVKRRDGDLGQGGLAGTSNVYLALKYGLKPSGTIAHEWIMAIGAKYGYKGANRRAMEMWEQVYPRSETAPPLTMLTDTYTASAFFEDYTSDPALAERWITLRQDSGDPFVFVREAKRVWTLLYEQKHGGRSNEEEALAGRRIIFSDGLDVERAVELQRGCDEMGVQAAFGIGTSLTNDFVKASDPGKPSKPLNIVIKLASIGGCPAVKLSDDKGKHTGDIVEVRRVQAELGLTGARKVDGPNAMTVRQHDSDIFSTSSPRRG